LHAHFSPLTRPPRRSQESAGFDNREFLADLVGRMIELRCVGTGRASELLKMGAKELHTSVSPDEWLSLAVKLGLYSSPAQYWHMHKSKKHLLRSLFAWRLDQGRRDRVAAEEAESAITAAASTTPPRPSTSAAAAPDAHAARRSSLACLSTLSLLPYSGDIFATQVDDTTDGIVYAARHVMSDPVSASALKATLTLSLAEAAAARVEGLALASASPAILSATSTPADDEERLLKGLPPTPTPPPSATLLLPANLAETVFGLCLDAVTPLTTASLLTMRSEAETPPAPSTSPPHLADPYRPGTAWTGGAVRSPAEKAAASELATGGPQRAAALLSLLDPRTTPSRDVASLSALLSRFTAGEEPSPSTPVRIDGPLPPPHLTGRQVVVLPLLGDAPSSRSPSPAKRIALYQPRATTPSPAGGRRKGRAGSTGRTQGGSRTTTTTSLWGVHGPSFPDRTRVGAGGGGGGGGRSASVGIADRARALGVLPVMSALGLLQDYTPPTSSPSLATGSMAQAWLTYNPVTWGVGPADPLYPSIARTLGGMQRAAGKEKAGRLLKGVYGRPAASLDA
jgi:hypothetical protein